MLRKRDSRSQSYIALSLSLHSFHDSRRNVRKRNLNNGDLRLDVSLLTVRRCNNQPATSRKFEQFVDLEFRRIWTPTGIEDYHRPLGISNGMNTLV